MTTRSRIEVASAEGKKFLKRVVKDTAKLRTTGAAWCGFTEKRNF